MGIKIRWNNLQWAKISIGYRNTQWPCPRGFHIGSKDEWQSLINSLTALWIYNVSDVTTALNIPSAYYLARSNGSKETRYWIARYWTSTMTSNTVAWAWGIDQNPTLVFQEDKPWNAFSIRPFKDEPVIPDSSWTESPSWIFKNATLWLISIQNGSNWITISDKNLWATNVWDNWLYYQFWNDYGFSVSPSSYVTSKPTFSDEYWPQSHYNSSVFVRVSSGNNWFNGTCNNIWWWVNPTWSWSQVKDVQAIYIWSTKIRPTVQLVLQGSTWNVYTDWENYLFWANENNIIMSVRNLFNTYSSPWYHTWYAEEFFLLRNRLTDNWIPWTAFLDLYNIDWQQASWITTKSYWIWWGYSNWMLDTRDWMQFYVSFQWSTNQGWNMTLEFADANFSNYNSLVPSSVSASTNFGKRFPVYLWWGAKISVTGLTDSSSPYMNRTSILSVANPDIVSWRGISPWYIDTYWINIMADMQGGQLMVWRNQSDWTITQWMNQGQVWKVTVDLTVGYSNGMHEIQYSIAWEDMQSWNPIQIDYGAYPMYYNTYHQMFENPFLRLPNWYSGSDTFSGSVVIY